MTGGEVALARKEAMGELVHLMPFYLRYGRSINYMKDFSVDNLNSDVKKINAIAAIDAAESLSGHFVLVYRVEITLLHLKQIYQGKTAGRNQKSCVGAKKW